MPGFLKFASDEEWFEKSQFVFFFISLWGGYILVDILNSLFLPASFHLITWAIFAVLMLLGLYSFLKRDLIKTKKSKSKKTYCTQYFYIENIRP